MFPAIFSMQHAKFPDAGKLYQFIPAISLLRIISSISDMIPAFVFRNQTEFTLFSDNQTQFPTFLLRLPVKLSAQLIQMNTKGLIYIIGNRIIFTANKKHQTQFTKYPLNSQSTKAN